MNGGHEQRAKLFCLTNTYGILAVRHKKNLFLSYPPFIYIYIYIYI